MALECTPQTANHWVGLEFTRLKEGPTRQTIETKPLKLETLNQGRGLACTRLREELIEQHFPGASLGLASAWSVAEKRAFKYPPRPQISNLNPDLRSPRNPRP